jgi:hypothetical protein
MKTANRKFTREINAYRSGKTSFITGLPPEQAVKMPLTQVLDILRDRLGPLLGEALSPDLPETLPPGLASPVASQPDGRWLRTANLVGVNVRTIGSFWNVVQYALTLPAAQSAIHLLPVWEPGVVSSLYGMVSWEINREFYNPELATHFPWLNTPALQLRAVVCLLHALGKTVGMDVIPHTDRFSEMALAFPEFYEWLQRKDTHIVDHSASLYQVVQGCIFEFLESRGPANPNHLLPRDCAEFFSPAVDETQRLHVLFGEPGDYQGRLSRRIALIHHLYRQGFETVPATMAPPFRGLEVDASLQGCVIDDDGLVWRNFSITHPSSMSRVFNPLARFQFYECQDEAGSAGNASWQLDFSRPRKPVWEYFCAKYASMQQRFGFDFMRGDMSHVQMRPGGVPSDIDAYYDPLGAVKRYIRERIGAPYFGYFAESFLAPRDSMGYGEEIDHLEASQADATLGDLQSSSLGSPEFLQRLRYYRDLLETRGCAPSFTILTADKDDPRFDSFYLTCNETRYFLGLLFTDMPSYMALGFETRDLHPEPAPNEYYTKLYVFQERKGSKSVSGPYLWGSNLKLFEALTRLRQFLEANWSELAGKPVRWLIPADATGNNPILAWTQAGENPACLFIVNTSAKTVGSFSLPFPLEGCQLELVFSVSPEDLNLGFTLPAAVYLPTGANLLGSGKSYYCLGMRAGECRAYRVIIRRDHASATS